MGCRGFAASAQRESCAKRSSWAATGNRFASVSFRCREITSISSARQRAAMRLLGAFRGSRCEWLASSTATGSAEAPCLQIATTRSSSSRRARRATRSATSCKTRFATEKRCRDGAGASIRGRPRGTLTAGPRTAGGRGFRRPEASPVWRGQSRGYFQTAGGRTASSGPVKCPEGAVRDAGVTH